MDQVAPKCSTLFLFDLGRSDCFRMLLFVLGCLRSLGCIWVVHVVKSDSDFFRLSG